MISIINKKVYMKFSIKATSIVEAMVSMMIITLWVTGMYKIYVESIRLSDSTANKIQAIEIAREWLEAVANIRDTNWLIFWSDYTNCWMTRNYNNTCIWDSSTAPDITHHTNYLVYQWNDNRWYLTWATAWDFETSLAYRNGNKVYLDDNGYYTHDNSVTGNSWTTSELKPLFTRVLHFHYQDLDSNGADSNDKKVEVKSLVKWYDSSSKNSHQVELKTTFSNWKQ